MENFSNKSNEDFQLKFSIDKWEREKVPNSDKSIIKYHVDIVSDISNNKWTVTRTLENFKTVINDLNFICLNIPTPPKIFGLKESTQTLTKIGKDFENYLKLLLNRADVINSQIIAEFFELNKHFEKLNQFVPNIKYYFNFSLFFTFNCLKISLAEICKHYQPMPISFCIFFDKGIC